MIDSKKIKICLKTFIFMGATSFPLTALPQTKIPDYLSPNQQICKKDILKSINFNILTPTVYQILASAHLQNISFSLIKRPNQSLEKLKAANKSQIEKTVLHDLQETLAKKDLPLKLHSTKEVQKIKGAVKLKSALHKNENDSVFSNLKTASLVSKGLGFLGNLSLTAKDNEDKNKIAFLNAKENKNPKESDNFKKETAPAESAEKVALKSQVQSQNSKSVPSPLAPDTLSENSEKEYKVIANGSSSKLGAVSDSADGDLNNRNNSQANLSYSSGETASSAEDSSGSTAPDSSVSSEKGQKLKLASFTPEEKEKYNRIKKFILMYFILFSVIISGVVMFVRVDD